MTLPIAVMSKLGKHRILIAKATAPIHRGNAAGRRPTAQELRLYQ